MPACCPGTQARAQSAASVLRGSLSNAPVRPVGASRPCSGAAWSVTGSSSMHGRALLGRLCRLSSAAGCISSRVLAAHAIHYGGPTHHWSSQCRSDVWSSRRGSDLRRHCSSSSCADVMMAEQVLGGGYDVSHSSEATSSCSGSSTDDVGSSSSTATIGNNGSDGTSTLPALIIPTAEEAASILSVPQLINAPAVTRQLPAPKVNPHIDIATDLGLALRLRDIFSDVDGSSIGSGSSSGNSSSSNSSSSSSNSRSSGGSPGSSYRSGDAMLTYNRDGTMTYSSNGRSASSSNTLATTTSATNATQQQPQQQGAPAAPASPISGTHRQRALTFCGNCCTPRKRHIDSCMVCGHRETNTAALTQPMPQAPEVAAAAAAMADARRMLANAGVLALAPTLLAFDERMLQHRAALWPAAERPERLQAIMARLQTAGLTELCEQLPGREATDAELLRVHSPGLIAAVAALSAAATAAELAPIQGYLGEELLGSCGTHAAARVAAGTAAEVAGRVARGEAAHAFAVIRPAGHMAFHDRAESGSYFNNAAVAARAAQAAGASRVLIVDWDVHHGRGTQSIFEDDASVTVVSLHRLDDYFFPGTGEPSSMGTSGAEGRSINIGWNAPRVCNAAGVQLKLPSVTDGDYITAFNHLVMPIAYELRPDIIIVSAGFDAADRDPVGELRLHPECYAHMTAMLAPVAPMVMLLEGGYNLSATAHSAELCLRLLLGERPDPLPGAGCAGITGWTSILRTLLVQQEHWHSLKLFDWVDLAISADSADDEAESADDDGDLDADAEWAVGSADSADDEAESSDDPELDIGSEWTINNAEPADDAASADDEEDEDELTSAAYGDATSDTETEGEDDEADGEEYEEWSSSDEGSDSDGDAFVRVESAVGGAANGSAAGCAGVLHETEGRAERPQAALAAAATPALVAAEAEEGSSAAAPAAAAEPLAAGGTSAEGKRSQRWRQAMQ